MKLKRINIPQLNPYDYWGDIGVDVRTYAWGNYLLVANIQMKPHHLLNVLFVGCPKSQRGKGRFKRFLTWAKKEFDALIFNTVMEDRFRGYLKREGFVDGGEELSHNYIWLSDNIDNMKIAVLGDENSKEPKFVELTRVNEEEE